MTKPILLAVALGAAILATGCAHRPAMTFQSTALDRSAADVRNAIAAAAKERGWSLCEEKPGHLYAQTDYKSFVVNAAIDYDATGFSMKGDTLDAKLRKPDGRVHRSVNNIVKRLSNTAKAFLDNTETPLEKFNVPACNRPHPVTVPVKKTSAQ